MGVSKNMGRNTPGSLGFPQPPERLAAKRYPKILVIPFRLSDTPKVKFDKQLREKYLKVQKAITALSDGQSQVEFVFNKIVDISYKRSDMVQLKLDTTAVSKRDETRSTYGFVRNFVKEYDSVIDLTNIDAIYLQGPPPDLDIAGPSYEYGIAEAMNYFKNSEDPLFRPIESNEGPIFNAVLHTGDVGNSDTILHEVMHLYGLVDLYYGNFPSTLSIMSGVYHSRLLNFEKWNLGWLPEKQIECLVEGKDFSVEQVSTRIKVPVMPYERMVVIKTPEPGSAYVIELSSNSPLHDPTDRLIYFFSFQNESNQRSPIWMATASRPIVDGIMLSKSKSWLFSEIGSYLTVGNYAVLISDISDEEITLDLIPAKRLGEVQSMIAAAKELGRQKSSDLRAREAKKTSTSVKCIKGKLTKTVSGERPSCPKGYKLSVKRK